MECRGAEMQGAGCRAAGLQSCRVQGCRVQDPRVQDPRVQDSGAFWPRAAGDEAGGAGRLRGLQEGCQQAGAGSAGWGSRKGSPAPPPRGESSAALAGGF